MPDRKINYAVFGDGDGSAPVYESMGVSETFSAYNRKPKGIPYIAHMNDDLTFTIVAAGEEQVEIYLREKEKQS